jgi:signal peptidase I
VSTQTKPKSTASSLLELVVIVVVALGLALAIQAFIVKPYRIPSSSMEPTLTIGQRVLVNRVGTHFSNPHVGEIVVFHPPQGADQNVSSCRVAVRPGSLCDLPITQRSSTNFIKRVVAGPGDSIAIQNGHVIRNGKPEADGYIAPCGGAAACTFSKPITIPAGYYFMMGDNRGESFDSRFWGPIPLKWIVGGAFATYWPPKRIGFL